MHTALANVYLDMPLHGFVPYVGVGLGAAFVTGKNLDSTTGIAGQFIVGAAFQVTQTLSLFADYRYLFTDLSLKTISSAGSTDINLGGSNILGGVRLNF
jgi:opacity protein-like surface antigen